MAKRFLVYAILFLAGVSFSVGGQAQQPEPESSRLLEPGHDILGKPYPEFKKDQNDEAKARVWDHALPFLAQRVIDKGFSLPLPYGASLIYFHQNQGLSIDSLSVAFSDTADLKDIGFIDFSGTKVDNSSWQFKLDAWVLPFLNVFLTLGSIDGTGSVPISIAKADLYDFFTPNLCSGGSPPAFCEGYFSAVAPIDYNGYSYGVGFLLATAVNNWIFAVPVTYVITDVNVSDDDVIATSIIPRLGYNITTARSGKFGVYVGANYLETIINLTGKYSLPLGTDPNVGQDVVVRYKLSQHPLDKWNGLAGVNWEMNQFLSLVLELGFAKDKENQTFILNYRF